MPTRPPRPCAHPGCPALVRKGSRCAAHAKKERARYETARGSSTARGYGPKWRRYRERFLIAHPWCVECGRLATVVDHIEDHRGDSALFWRPSNHQSMCASCHSTKTGRTAGGFWRPNKGMTP